MDYLPVNLSKKLALFNEHWQPKVIAEMNDYQFKLAKLKGEFIWHQHDETDETFIILSGSLDIEFRDGSVTLQAGEMLVVPKGVEHKPVAHEEAHVMLIEPRGVINTGNSANQAQDSDVSDLKAENDVWI